MMTSDRIGNATTEQGYYKAQRDPTLICGVALLGYHGTQSRSGLVNKTNKI